MRVLSHECSVQQTVSLGWKTGNTEVNVLDFQVIVLLQSFEGKSMHIAV